MKRIVEDIQKENFTRREIVYWGIVYPVVGLAVFVVVSVLIGRI